MSFQDILLESPSEHVLRITLNRPDARNALRRQLLEELTYALHDADADDAVRCVILTGGEKVFAAGSDIKEFAGKTKLDMQTDPRQELWKSIRAFSKPMVAAVNGYCLGGGNELVMLCDIVVAGEDAKFGQPEIKLGLIPGAGGTQRLTAAIGKARAMKCILSGEFISAEDAFNWGLVSELVDTDKAQDRAVEIATTIASMSPIAVKYALQAVRTAADSNEAGFKLERELLVDLFETEDLHEGISAFIEKRKPEFQGR